MIGITVQHRSSFSLFAYMCIHDLWLYILSGVDSFEILDNYDDLHISMNS